MGSRRASGLSPVRPTMPRVAWRQGPCNNLGLILFRWPCAFIVARWLRCGRLGRPLAARTSVEARSSRASPRESWPRPRLATRAGRPLGDCHHASLAPGGSGSSSTGGSGAGRRRRGGKKPPRPAGVRRARCGCAVASYLAACGQQMQHWRRRLGVGEAQQSSRWRAQQRRRRFAGPPPPDGSQRVLQLWWSS